MHGPLNGIRVLDFTSVLMGPYCTLLMGDMGADVIKIESPSGDTTRYISPSRSHGMGSLFLNLNRNKRSIVLDLKQEKGREAFLRLARNSDVFIHSLRPQAIERLGLSYQEVSSVNKQIIYCGTYGFGKDGPYAAKPAYDDIIQGASGLAAAQGKMTGTPQYLSTVIADKTTGLIALNAILAALLYRKETGIGQEIEVPMFETMVSFAMIEHMYAQTFVPPLGPSFYPRATSPYRKPYQTQDGYISVLIYNDKQWRSFFEASGHLEFMADERFKSMGSRTENIDFVYKTVEEIMLTRTTAEWLDILEKADIPCMPLNTPEDLFQDPHLQQVGFFKKVVHPTEGEIRDTRFPVSFSVTPAQTRRYAPRLGQHSREILMEAGYSQEEIEQMIQQRVTVGG